jgi:hypothetical protein
MVTVFCAAADARLSDAVIAPRLDRPSSELDDSKSRLDRGCPCVCRDGLCFAIWKQETECETEKG